MVDTTNLRGEIAKGARVEWMDPALPAVLLEIKGRIRESLEIEPHYLLIEAFPGERKPATTTITNREGDPLHVAKVQSDRRDVKTTLQEIEAGRKYKLLVEREPNLSPGAYRGKVELVLEQSTRQNPQIPLTIIVEPKVYLNRGAVVFRNRSSGTVTVIVEKYKDPEFKVSNLKCDLPYVSGEVVPLPYENNTARYELRFTLRADNAPANPFEGTLSFETNDQDFPRFTLPVMGQGLRAGVSAPSAGQQQR